MCTHRHTYTQPQPTSSAFLGKLRLHQLHLGKETLELSFPLFCALYEPHVHTVDGAEHQHCNDDDHCCCHRHSDDNNVEVVLQHAHGLIQVTTDEHLHTHTHTKGTMETLLNVFTLHMVESECMRETREAYTLQLRNIRLHSTHHIQKGTHFHICFPL